MRQDFELGSISVRLGHHRDHTARSKARITSGAGTFARWIPARGEAIIEVEVSGDIKRLIRAFPGLALKRQPWPYRLAGTLAPVPGLRITYDHRGEIDARDLLQLAASLR